jgi:hypothetical protein
LAAAVEFIVECLDSGDFDALGTACEKAHEMQEQVQGLPSPAEYRRRAIAGLAQQHQQTRLDKLYSGLEFPDNITTHKLGGHGKELGHIHIDFRQAGEMWFLGEIWVCR